MVHVAITGIGDGGANAIFLINNFPSSLSDVRVFLISPLCSWMLFQ